MKTAATSATLLLALLFATGLCACGGSDGNSFGGTVATPPSGGGGSGGAAACTPDRYIVTLSSSSPPVSDEPRTVRMLVNCGGNVVVVPNVAVDWTVTSGGGSVNGSATARTTTSADGISEVVWRFGSITEVQSIAARLNGVSPLLHAALSRTVLAAGPNPCEAPGGTDLGASHTVSTDTTWTRAGSPYFQCPAATPCAGEVVISGGAVLTIEAGVAVCVNAIRTADAGRIVATGTPAEPIHFGVRNRAGSWGGMVFQPGSLFSGASVLRHTVIENPSGINATAHPIIVEDALIRHDPALVAALAAVYESSGAGCGAMFEIEQHAIAGIAPSRVARTVIDGLGGPPSWWSALLPQEFDAGCPALRVLTSAETPPLVISARVINSRGPGVGLVIGGLAKGNETLLTDCEISGSEWVGMYVAADPTADSLPRVTSCNVFGNARDGVVNWAAMQLDARGNWWGDPTGPQGPQGDGVARFGEVDANDPLAAPVGLDY